MTRLVMPSAITIALVVFLSAALAPLCAADDVTLPKSLSSVWLKTPKKKLNGDLILTADGIEFDSRKRQVFVPFESIDMIGYGSLPGDVDTEWTVLRVVEDGVYRRYSIRDGKRFGYGTRTVEIYELVRTVMRQQKAGQFRVADGYRVLDLFDTQFATEYPIDWQVTHQDLIEADSGMFFGSAVIASTHVVPESKVLPDDAIVLHRREVSRGMSCTGFTGKGLEQLGAVLDELGHTGVDLSKAKPAPLGGCAGLLLAGGDSPAELRAASDGVTLTVLELQNPTGLDAVARVPFDHAVEAFQFAWGY